MSLYYKGVSVSPHTQKDTFLQLSQQNPNDPNQSIRHPPKAQKNAFRNSPPPPPHLLLRPRSPNSRIPSPHSRGTEQLGRSITTRLRPLHQQHGVRRRTSGKRGRDEIAGEHGSYAGEIEIMRSPMGSDAGLGGKEAGMAGFGI